MGFWSLLTIRFLVLSLLRRYGSNSGREQLISRDIMGLCLTVVLGQALSSGQLAKVYGFTDLDGSQPDAWRYVREVQDAGKPADATGYR